MAKENSDRLKVLWIAYQPLPAILKEIKPEAKIVTGGWLEGAAENVIARDEIELSYCFQYLENVDGRVGGITYFSMPVAQIVTRKEILRYREKDFVRFKKFVEQVKPDIIQIFGTETWFQRQFAFMLQQMGLIDRTVVWIQGLSSFCANSYYAGLELTQIKRKTIWEFIRGTNVQGIKKRLEINGFGESRELSVLRNVFVRTDWDKACCKAFNPQLKMFHCNETLRPAFYQDIIWNIEGVEKFSIFMSQCGTPIKGFHQMLKAMSIIVKEFPEAKLYVTGNDLLVKPHKVMDRVREQSYFRMLREEIYARKIEHNIVFLGTLYEKEMRDRYVKSNVFVSASTIENSPNSVAEAMILGVPTIASDVGGVSSMVLGGKEGLLYPFYEYALLAECICKVFRDSKLAEDLSHFSRLRALETHDQEQNYELLMQSYRLIMKDSQR